MKNYKAGMRYEMGILKAYTKTMKEAARGRKQWNELKVRYRIDEGLYVLLMAEEDQELNELALKHIERFVRYRKAAGVLILTTQDWIIEKANKNEQVKAALKISTEELNRYYYYYHCHYRYASFSNRFIIVSLREPYGNNAYEAIGINGITKEDMLCLSLYIMRDWQGVTIESV